MWEGQYKVLWSTQELRMTFVTDNISCANSGLARQGAANSTQIPGAPRNTPFPGSQATVSCLAGGLPPPPHPHTGQPSWRDLVTSIWGRKV